MQKIKNNIDCFPSKTIHGKFEMDTVCRYNSSQTEVDNSIIEYVENLLKQYGIVLWLTMAKFL